MPAIENLVQVKGSGVRKAYVGLPRGLLADADRATAGSLDGGDASRGVFKGDAVFRLAADAFRGSQEDVWGRLAVGNLAGISDRVEEVFVYLNFDQNGFFARKVRRSQ